MGSGALSQLFLGAEFEAALGGGSTDIGSTAAIEAFLNSSIKPMHADEGIAEVTGYHPQKDSTRVGLATGGDLSGPVGATLLAWMLKMVFMKAPTPTGAGDPYALVWADPLTPNSGTALFTPQTMPEESFSIIEQVGRITNYGVSPKGLIGLSLSITWSGSGKVTATLNVAGNGVIATSVAAPSGALMSDHGRYLLGSMTGLTIGGVNVSTALRGGTLTITPGMAFTDRCGSTAGEKTAIDQASDPNVDLTFDLDETALAAEGGLTEYLNAAGAPYGAALPNVYVLTFNGDANRQVEFTIHAGKVEGEYPVAIGDKGPLGVQRKVKAYCDATNWYQYLDVTAKSKYDLSESV